MKTLTGLFFLIMSLSSVAQEMSCLDKLLPYNKFSGSHVLNRDEWPESREALDPEISKRALTYLISSKLLCKQDAVSIKLEPVCSLIDMNQVQSQSCFIYTNVGFFVLNRDNGRNINLIFNRDKRFSDGLDD
jgi:hypothetical protein